MRFQLLPGFSQLFVDWAEGRAGAGAILAARPSIQSLCAKADALLRAPRAPALEHSRMRAQAVEFHLAQGSLANIARLADGHAVAVASFHEPALYGGLLRDIAKVLTAVRLACELERQGISAVPVCCATGGSRARTGILGFVDSRQGFQGMPVTLPEGSDPDGRPCLLVPAEADDYLQALGRRLGLEGTGTSALHVFRTTHPVGSPLKLAWGRLMGELLAPWGAVIVDLEGAEMAARARAHGGPAAAGWTARIEERGQALTRAGHRDLPAVDPAFFPAPLALGCLVPVASIVAGPDDIADLAVVWDLLGEIGRPHPVVWPQASLTLVEARSRKTMAAYAVSFEAIFRGADFLADSLSPVQKLEGPLRDLEDARVLLASASAHVPTLVRGNRERSRLETLARRIDYQLCKLQERCRRHHERRQGVLRQRMGRLCNRLAPGGALQEVRLPLVQIQLESSGAALAGLLERIDIEVFEHQTVDWD